MKKRFLSVVLCLCMVVGMLPTMVLPVAAIGQYGVNLDNSAYRNKYAKPQCTWYCWGRAMEKCGVDLTFGGNAVDWYDNAKNAGFSVGTTARDNSIAVFRDTGWGLPGYGHVVFIERVSGNTAYYSEGNYLGTEYHEGSFDVDSGGLYIGNAQWEQRLVGYVYLGSSASSQPSVSFSPWSKDGYTYVHETDASVGQLITVSNGNCTETGMELYNASGQKVASGRNSSYNPATPQIYFKINEECGYTLAPGTTYKYKFYAVVNGQTHWGSEDLFTTSGIAPQPTPRPTSQPTPQPTTSPSPNLPANATMEAEINDTIDHANNISVNTEIVGSISKSSDVDWYSFQVPNDGHISITFDHDFVNSSSPYWKTSFYTSDNKELDTWTWKGNTTLAKTENENGIPAGTYYLRISRSTYNSSAAYRFTVNYTPSNSWEQEYNETIVTANRISTGMEVSGSIRTSSDADWYQFELPENGAISLTFSHDFVNSSSPYWKTAFYTGDNKELNSWTWKGNTTTAVTENKIGVSAGTYYLCVKRSTYNSSATYRFTVNYDLSPNSSEKPAAVRGIALDRTSISLTLGSSSVLTAEVTPSNAMDKTVLWQSENTAVAVVASGRVTAVGEGSTRITASCGNVTASCTVSVTAEGSQSRPGGVHFERVNTYFQDQFTDVPANQWYTSNVAEAFELGLMKGDSKTAFNPYGDVSISEAVTMAARIHSIFTKGFENFQQTGDKWYQVYMDYAYENGIINLAYYNCDVSQKASRAQFAEIFANSMPAEGLSAINNVADGAIPDVNMGNRYAEYIYKLYRAGILAGSDVNGTFNPSTYITRAEAAAVVSRMAESNNRVSITLR